MNKRNNTNKSIILGVCASISAYKAAFIASSLTQKGINVRVIFSDNADKFVGELTFAALTGNRVYARQFDPSSTNPMEHIDILEGASLALVAPASANSLAKFAHGFADDCLSSTLLAMDWQKTKLLLAPAMNEGMWQSAATHGNLKILRERGAHIIEPTSGHLACGQIGIGRLADIEKIVATVSAELER